MKFRRASVVATVALGLVVVASAAQGDPLGFTEDFSGGTLPSNLEEPLVSGGTDFSGGNATFNQPAHFLRTKDFDFNTVSFVFEGTLTLTNAGLDSTGYLGMGPGFNISGPSNAPTPPALYGSVSPAAYLGGFFSAVDHSVVTGTTERQLFGISNGGWGAGSVHRFRMTWDAVATTADFDLDQNFTGTFTSDFSASLDGSDNGFSSVSSHLFVGGGEDSSWDDLSVTVFTVVPEPSSALLLGTGLAFLAARRRLR
ncbi:MAG: PEP-CTERM sorting domain-containing protein [Myxococcota bacterium]|nr:PEP-CTERM sorting domain-containing protein [Myxococcota bacterium]